MNDRSYSPLLILIHQVLYWLVLSACVLVPWGCHFALGWWAGLLAFIPLVALYRALFVPEGSICMGVPFGLVVVSFLGLVVLDVSLLLLWAIAHIL